MPTVSRKEFIYLPVNRLICRRCWILTILLPCSWDDFRIEFNEDGSPSQYVSEVTILEQGQKVDQAVISVNYPLNYQGLRPIRPALAIGLMLIILLKTVRKSRRVS